MLQQKDDCSAASDICTTLAYNDAQSHYIACDAQSYYIACDAQSHYIACDVMHNSTT